MRKQSKNAQKMSKKKFMGYKNYKGYFKVTTLKTFVRC